MQSQYHYVLKDFTQSKYSACSSACTSPSSASFSSWPSSVSENKGDKHSKPHYKCKTCSKLFSRPSALKTHTYIHTGEKPYQCNRAGCGRRFSVISNLRRHVKIHQKPSLPAKLTAEERIECVRRLMEKCKDLDMEQESDEERCLPRLSSLPTDTNSKLSLFSQQHLLKQEWTPWSVMTTSDKGFHDTLGCYYLHSA
ncbi:hypothetical protein BY458DRAFT_522626 [Sporodiniella umbellata]|nr:hypothetical protein BY458DRAFT_522626 [Sporodiniella umbellata]